MSAKKLTIREAAERLGVSYHYIWTKIQYGSIRAKRILGHPYIEEEEIERWERGERRENAKMSHRDMEDRILELVERIDKLELQISKWKGLTK